MRRASALTPLPIGGFRATASRGRRYAAPESVQISPEPAHKIDESGKARGDETRIVDPYRLRARHPHHQRRHGNAVIHVRRDEAAANRTALPLHDEIIAGDFDRHAV